LTFSYRDRRARRGDFRQLWIIRINAAARAGGLKYSEFMHGLKVRGITLDRSVLAELALHDESAFTKLLQEAKTALAR
jgi:large subunit ribosomal protein L20